jgi:hypothetical protein
MEKILSLDEANNGKHTVLKTGGDNIKLVVFGDLINQKFKEFCVTTTSKEMDEMIELIKTRYTSDNKLVWVRILRELNKYDKPTLEYHFTNKTKEWDNWANDCVLWYCYNAVVFNKGIPVSLYDDIPEGKLIKNF